jgi:hypothetical protein
VIVFVAIRAVLRRSATILRSSETSWGGSVVDRGEAPAQPAVAGTPTTVSPKAPRKARVVPVPADANAGTASVATATATPIDNPTRFIVPPRCP